MHLTRKKPTLLFASVALVAAAAACGQVTGLSDDYDFDLVVEGGVRNDASDGSSGGDAATSDAPTDGSAVSDAPRDATNTCTAGQTATAVQSLNTYNGTPTCKACLAPACCTDVETCFNNTPCSKALACRLDCTARNSAERTQCFTACDNVGGGPPPLYVNGIASCAASACKQQCGFR